MSRRFDAYRVSRNDNLAAPDFWNRRFEDIDLRITARENDIDAMDTLFGSIESLALSRMNDVFTPLIQQAQEALNSFGISFSAETLSSVLVGTGAKQVTLTEETRGGFYYAEYVALRADDDANVTMLAKVTDYTRATGVLELDVISVAGAGTHAGWQIIVGSPPDETHASRTDNPHSVTASQVGAYTTAQVDDAISNAISSLPEIADALRPTNNLSDVSDKQTARSNLGVLNSALNFSDVPNKATARNNLGVLGRAGGETIEGTLSIAGDLTLENGMMRLSEDGTKYLSYAAGVYSLGAAGTIWHSGNFNPASKQDAFSGTPWTSSNFTPSSKANTANPTFTGTANFANISVSSRVGGTMNFTNIDASGTIKVAGSAPGLILEHSGAPNHEITFRGGGPGGNDSWHLYNGGQDFFIINGPWNAGVGLYFGSTSWVAWSDRRIKENFTELTVLDKLKTFRAGQYTNTISKQVEIGVIAQEQIKLWPELVHEGTDDSDEPPSSLHDPRSWSVTYDRYGVIAMQGLKELLELVKEQNERIAKLEAMLTK